MPIKDPTVFLGRKNPDAKYSPVSKFDARLRSHNRSVEKMRDEVRPPDTPRDQFTTKVE